MTDRRVVHVLGPSAGGIRNHVRYLAAHPAPGWRTEAVCGPADLRRYFTGVEFRALGRARYLAPPATGDVVHCHGLTPGTYALQPSRPPVVITLHMDVATQGRTARSPLLRALAPVIAGRAEGLIAVSERIARRFRRARVIPPAFEPLPPASRPPADVRQELGATPEDVVVLTLARLHPDKGLDTFVASVEAAAAVGWIAGDGPLRGELERRTATSAVRVLGYREDVADLLAAADVFALPATGEGYGIAVVEALQSGVPVVATRAGAMPELVGDAGVLCEPGDRGGFTEALKTIVADAALRGRLADAARARSFPPPEELVWRIGQVYDEVAR